MFDQQTDQRRLKALLDPKREAEQHVRLAAAPVVKQESARRPLQAVEVEAADEVGQHGGDQVAQVAGLLQQPADRPIREVVQRRVIEQRHRRAPPPTLYSLTRGNRD